MCFACAGNAGKFPAIDVNWYPRISGSNMHCDTFVADLWYVVHRSHKLTKLLCILHKRFCAGKPLIMDKRWTQNIFCQVKCRCQFLPLLAAFDRRELRNPHPFSFGFLPQHVPEPCLAIVVWRCRKPINQWGYSFHMKAALTLFNMFAIALIRRSNTDPAFGRSCANKNTLIV